MAMPVGLSARLRLLIAVIGRTPLLPPRFLPAPCPAKLERLNALVIVVQRPLGIKQYAVVLGKPGLDFLG